jgi:sigma-B regulation protein RsbU (phosphoserine phosphatase)
MEATERAIIRAQLVDRRHRLEEAMSGARQEAQLAGLLQEVDSALERMSTGTYGFCEVCHGAMSEGTLLADPLLRVCIDCLDATQRAALEQDLQLASRTQQALLPSRDTQTNGWHISYHYEPAGLVSGDYCDIVECPAGGFLFIVGDVSGKGVAASMLMTQLHATFRSLNAFGLPINELVGRANRQLCESTLSTHYSTLVCGRADPMGDIEICNAGHCPPLIIRAAETNSVEATGLPVGLFRAGDYGVTRTRLEPGDSIVLYTDGLSEARRGEQEYREERIARVVSEHHAAPPGQLVDLLLQDVTGFLSGAPRTDDLTIMVIQRALGETSG